MSLQDIRAAIAAYDKPADIICVSAHDSYKWPGAVDVVAQQGVWGVHDEISYATFTIDPWAMDYISNWTWAIDKAVKYARLHRKHPERFQVPDETV